MRKNKIVFIVCRRNKELFSFSSLSLLLQLYYADIRSVYESFCIQMRTKKKGHIAGRTLGFFFFQRLHTVIQSVAFDLFFFFLFLELHK
jgi:hypothetical protein